MNEQQVRPSVVIVVPCYNEAKRLNVEEFAIFQLPDRGLQVLFVDDGSGDGTAQVLETLCATAPDRLAYARLPKNMGKAEAVRLGMTMALQRQPAYAGYWDADLATPLSQVSLLCGVLDARPDIHMAFASRVRLMGRTIRRRAFRHYFGRVFATMASLTLELPIYDTQCGAKLFRASDMLEEIFATPFASRWVFDVEILARARSIMAAHGIDVASAVYEVPINAWQDVHGSKTRLTDAAQAFWELAKIRRLYFRR
jgi:dolichyl-phosphate beta-glucosyltransferase